MTTGLQLSGLTIEGGVSISGTGASTSFTISPSDFTNYYTGGATSNGTNGFSISGSGAIGVKYYSINTSTNAGFSVSKQTELENYFTTNGLSYYSSYMFNVTWNDSSTSVVCLTYNPNNNMPMSVVDTTISGWDTPNQDVYTSPQSLPGTYSFPATFTLYSPLITDNNDWC